MEPTYPITITREALLGKGACEEGLQAFDEATPSGKLLIPDVLAHMALLAGPLAPFEGWAQETGLLPPIRYAGGYGSHVSGGDDSHVSGGRYSNVSGGAFSRVSGGKGSHVSGGAYSRVSGGADSHVSGGYGSTLHLRYWDGARSRTAVAYVGEDGIEPDTFYKYEHPTGWVKA